MARQIKSRKSTATRKKKAPPETDTSFIPLLRRELTGLFFLFMVLFVFGSLVSYHPTDPSAFQPHPAEAVKNLFGVFGAELSGFLIGIFGLGAFWIPPLLLVFSIHFFRKTPVENLSIPTLGAAMLVLGTSGFFALWGDSVTLFGAKVATGGAAGQGLKNLMVYYFGNVGGFFIFILMGVVAILLTTGISVLDTGFRLFRWGKRQAPKAGAGLRGYWKKGRDQVAAIPLQASIENMRRLLPSPTRPFQPMDAFQNDLPEESAPKKSASERNAKNTRKYPENNDDDFVIEGTVITGDDVSDSAAPLQRFTDSGADPDAHPAEPDADEAAETQIPNTSFLAPSETSTTDSQDEHLKKQALRLEAKLADFGVKGQVVGKYPGPVITTFEFKPAPGVKINKIVNLTDDLAMALRALSVRIIAPIPGKAVVGIEIPNPNRDVVRLRDIVASEAFRKSESRLTICMGKDIVGRPVVSQLDRMPHLLIAGATGTGKSVFLNTLICSLIYKSGPEAVKFIMIDPKRIELSMYSDIPHQITPVVTDVKKATHALFWAVGEMEHRYELLSDAKVRNIRQYNRKVTQDDDYAHLNPLPFIVLIIDELADLMMVASRDVELSLTRLAQMARAAGIHLILATQRPSVDVLTGIIKANFPTRLTFQVSSKVDSRTIIDGSGAESLLGNGDMLFLPPGTGRLQRIHGAYISEDELVRITDFLKSQRPPDYNEDVVASPLHSVKKSTDEKYDEKYDDAVALVTQTRQASVTFLQKQLKIGRARAAKILQTMESEGVVGPSDGTEPREVLVRGYGDMPDG